MIDLYFPGINLYSGLINHWSVLLFLLWLYCLSPFGLPKIELYYLYNWWLTYVTCLYYLSIIFILFINNHWFSLWFSYDYFITLLFTSIWLTYTTELSFIYINLSDYNIYSICFIVVDLYYWYNQSLIYTIFVLFYLSNLTLFHLFNKIQMAIYSTKYIISIWQYSYWMLRIINYQTYRSNFILNSII